MTHEELNNLADHLWVARMHTDDRLDQCVLDAAIAVLTRMRDRAKSSSAAQSLSPTKQKGTRQ